MWLPPLVSAYGGPGSYGGLKIKKFCLFMETSEDRQFFHLEEEPRGLVGVQVSGVCTWAAPMALTMLLLTHLPPERFKCKTVRRSSAEVVEDSL